MEASGSSRQNSFAVPVAMGASKPVRKPLLDTEKQGEVGENPETTYLSMALNIFQVALKIERH